MVNACRPAVRGRGRGDEPGPLMRRPLAKLGLGSCQRQRRRLELQPSVQRHHHLHRRLVIDTPQRRDHTARAGIEQRGRQADPLAPRHECALCRATGRQSHVVGPGLWEVWDGRVVVAWHKWNISIVSRAGLVAMKRLAGRPQDLADIAILEGTDEDDQE